ncbi:MFS transporter [Microbacterium sp. G2-8]|uniref:MFS transporter n=1 Tax=Microbacterium sp. G2-8 TaxID=2842454 RepID=UPI001C892EDF|nr:MFS transporter [Microbacterium sp. G2-8]
MSDDSGWQGHRHGDAAFRRVLLALFAAGFATFAQVFDAQAVLPAMSAELGIAPSTASLSLSFATLGMAASVLPWASVADRFGRVPTMKVALVVSGVVGVLTPLMPTFELFLAMRAIMGAALGAVPAVAMAYLAEEIHSGHIARAASIYISGNTIGGIVGRLVAGQLAEATSWRVGIEAVSLLAVAAGVAFLLTAPRPRGYRPQRVRLRVTLRSIAFNLRDPLTLSLYAIGFLHMGAFAGLYNYLGYRLQDPPFSVPATVVNLFFLAYLIGAACSQLSPRLVPRWGIVQTMTVGFALEIIGVALTLPSSITTSVVGLALFTAGWGFIHPIVSGQSGSRAQVGRAQSTALFQLSWLVGTALFGWLIGLALERAAWPGAAGTIAALVVASCTAAWVGMHALARHRPTPPA